MEPRQTFCFNEKNSSIINNSNLKDYSCFIGGKTIYLYMFIQYIYKSITKVKNSKNETFTKL